MTYVAAHKKLYKIWGREKNNFDLLVKIDADSVLVDDQIISTVFHRIQKLNSSGAHLRMLDYFSGDLVHGMNFYCPDVKFAKLRNTLFPDLNHKPSRHMLINHDVADLEPVAFHCVNPTKKQSFYYGFYRHLKKQDKLMSAVADKWSKDQDPSREWALIGAMSAQRYLWRSRWISSRTVERRYQFLLKHYIPSDDLQKFVNQRYSGRD